MLFSKRVEEIFKDEPYYGELQKYVHHGDANQNVSEWLGCKPGDCSDCHYVGCGIVNGSNDSDDSGRSFKQQLTDTFKNRVSDETMEKMLSRFV